MIDFSGISFCGSDVGGFFGNPQEELFVRWYQAAAFQPFFRSHANLETERREPYLLADPARSIVRDAIRKRYAFLPLWYTMFFEHERNGNPVMRPMLTDYPLDKTSYKLDNQYMLSDKLLVCPVIEEAKTKIDVHFPSTDGDKAGDVWYDIDDCSKIETVGTKSVDVVLTKTPVYQRGGTIIPKKETIRKSSVYMIDDPISLIVAVSNDHKASGTLYLDDEKSYEYRSKKYLYLQFEFEHDKLTSKKIDTDATYAAKNKLGKVLIAGLGTVPSYATIKTADGKETRLEVKAETDNFFEITVTPDVSFTEDWTITLNGAKQNILCATLLLVTLMAHASKHLF